MRSNARSKPMGITGPRLAPQSHALGVDDSPMNPLRLLRLNRRSGTAGRRPPPCLEASSSSGSLSAPSKPRPSARSRTSSGPIRASVSLPRTASSSRPLAIDRYRSEYTAAGGARSPACSRRQGTVVNQAVTPEHGRGDACESDRVVWPLMRSRPSPLLTAADVGRTHGRARCEVGRQDKAACE